MRKGLSCTSRLRDAALDGSSWRVMTCLGHPRPVDPQKARSRFRAFSLSIIPSGDVFLPLAPSLRDYAGRGFKFLRFFVIDDTGSHTFAEEHASSSGFACVLARACGGCPTI